MYEIRVTNQGSAEGLDVGDRTRQREGWPAGTGVVPRPRSVAAILGTLIEARTSRKTHDSVPDAEERR